MARIAEVWRKVVFFWRRDRLDLDLEEEMRDHLRRKVEKNIAAGMSSEDALAAARRQLGNFTRQREESRSIRGFPLLESIFQDLHYGLRGLRNSPGFAVVAVLTLALGIGATTAIFSITNAVVLRQLAYKDAGRLVHVWGETTRFPGFKMGISYPNVQDLRSQAHSFEALGFYRQQRMVLTGSGEPEQITAVAISPDFFRVLSIRPFLGSEFQPGDEEMKNGHVVILNYSLWQRRFASDPAIIGRTIHLDRVPYTVAGVLPKGFAIFLETVWIPLVVPAKEKDQRDNWMFMTVAKLKPGVSVRAAQAEMNQFQARLAQAYPKEEADGHLEIMLLRDGAVNEDNRRQLLTMVAAVSFLLLIACANVSNLVLSRGVQRQREIVLRAALGASRSRILRQLLAESPLLALIGGAAGLLLADAGIRAFRILAPSSFARMDEVRMEPVVAVIAVLVSCVAGLLCGLAPALHTSRVDLAFALKDRGGVSLSRAVSLRNFLVISEVALALVLLVGSALMAQSFARLMKVDPGFRTDHLLTADIQLGNERYPSEDAQRLFIQRLLESLRAEPQFKDVALANNGLLRHLTAVFNFNPEFMGIHEKSMTVEAKSVSPGFFEAMRIALLAGRSFNDRDTKGTPQVVIISQSLANRFFPGQSPVDKIFKLGPAADDSYQVVGVVADTRDIELGQSLRPQMYFPMLQAPYNGMNVMVRSSGGDPLRLEQLLQQRVRVVDKDQPLVHVASMSEVIAKSVAEPRFRTWLFGSFAVAGLMLTLIGIYGVISYWVNQRTQEMGIRVALGAQRRDVLALVVRQGIGLTVIGAVLGLAGSFALMRLLASQLYGIKPSDPFTLAGTALLMLAVAVCASYIPARRATRIDPMAALRNE